MKNKELKDIAKLLKDLSGVDIFEDSRSRKHTEPRSLFNFILRNHYNFTLYDIKDYYISMGKSYNHATALYSLRNFEVYRKYNEKLDEWLDIFKQRYTDEDLKRLKRETIKHKIDYIGDDYVSRIYRIVNKLPIKNLTQSD